MRAQVVDLFGAGVPVAALRYGCIDELVRDGETGALFDDDVGLATHLDELLRGFPHDTARLDTMRARVSEWRAVGWEEHWTRVAAPILLESAAAAPST
jgi:beta-1,4-mannosyltransferase